MKRINRMKKNLKNNDKLLVHVGTGIMMATAMLVLTISLDKCVSNIYYFILFLIGPPLLVSLIENFSFIYTPFLYIYFIALSIIFWKIRGKLRILILVIVLLVHLLSTALFLYEVNSSFKFLEDINWNNVLSNVQK